MFDDTHTPNKKKRKSTGSHLSGYQSAGGSSVGSMTKSVMTSKKKQRVTSAGGAGKNDQSLI